MRGREPKARFLKVKFSGNVIVSLAGPLEKNSEAPG
jgi:hypothetical protein